MKSMRKFLILFFTFLIGAGQSFAFDVVLPKEKKLIMNTKYAFFVGHARIGESVTVNGEHVPLASNGAFAFTMKLKEGENRIVLKSNYHNTRFYKIYKSPAAEVIKPKLEEFDKKYVSVLKDNTPMRDTPVDYGMNRISHLFGGTTLIVDGEKNGFYRVFLSKNKTGWIAKSAVTDIEPSQEAPKFITMSSETFKNASVNTIEFTGRLPYTIDETNNEIIFKVYNPQFADNSIYTVNIRKPKKYTYKVTLTNGVYVVKVNALPVPDNENLEDINIVVDPGHGGSEKGAIGCLGDEEKEINLNIASELKDILTQMGANVIMTRECDGEISLDDRVKMAKDNNANIFVSVHLNSIPDIEFNSHKNRGTSVYYYNENSKEFAKIVENYVTEAAGTRKGGAKAASFAVIRPTEYVGILVECAYMTNPYDSVLYKSDSFARNVARGIADGILNYVNNSCN